MVLFNTIPIANGVNANVKLLLPLDLKKDQKYPMVLRVYAGPGTTRVKDNYDLGKFYSYPYFYLIFRLRRIKTIFVKKKSQKRLPNISIKVC